MGQDGASLPQLAPYRRPDDQMGRTTGQQLLPINESLVVGATRDVHAHPYVMSM